MLILIIFAGLEAVVFAALLDTGGGLSLPFDNPKLM
jgi:hypothetical protein